MTVRKNFLLDDEVAKHLEEIAKKENTSQTNIIKKMIEQRYEEYSKEQKLAAFRAIIPMPDGSLVEQSIQSIKAEMANKI